MPAWKAKLMTKLHLSNERVLLAESLASHYARASTYWGVELQKLGKWEEGAACFERALALNPDNVAAQINLAFNTAHRKGEPAPVDFASSVEDCFGKYRNWNDVMGDCGPFDEPRFTFEQGRTFLSGRLHRQALIQMKRVTEIDPNNLIASIWLADLYTILSQPSEAIAVVQHVRRNPSDFGLNPTNQLDLARVEISALFRSGEKEVAKLKLEQALAKKEAGSQFRLVASQLYLQNGLYPEALPLLDRAIAENPSDIMALANRGFTCLQLGQYTAAKESLTHAIELDPKNTVARLNRAITLVRLKEWDAAREDYELLLQEFPNSYQVLYGLGDVAAGKGDLTGAVRHYEESMKLTPSGSRDYLQVSNRLAELKAPKK
jgi:tetratricopeptide (TPR) repeat protein